MNADEKAEVIAAYLKYLRWNRLPFTLPTSRKQAAELLSQILGFRKALSAFITGFVLAKLDLLFQGAVARNLANSPVFIGRIFLFATTMMICAQFTYVARHNLGAPSVESAHRRAAPRISF